MTAFTFHRRARFTLWLAAIALLFAALSPTLNLLRIKAIGQPQLFAELCTKMGIVKVPIATDTGKAPLKSDSAHAPECAACLPGGTWLAMAGDDSPTIAALDTREPAPTSPAASTPHLLVHTRAWSRGPPVVS